MFSYFLLVVVSIRFLFLSSHPFLISVFLSFVVFLISSTFFPFPSFFLPSGFFFCLSSFSNFLLFNVLFLFFPSFSSCLLFYSLIHPFFLSMIVFLSSGFLLILSSLTSLSPISLPSDPISVLRKSSAPSPFIPFFALSLFFF